MIDPEDMRRFGASVDFGNTATDYATHRAGFPSEFFAFLAARGYVSPGQSALDIGTGTGSLARGLAKMHLEVSALDPAQTLLDQAARLDQEAGVTIRYTKGQAETLPYADDSFDLVTAGQCWHWFDRPTAARELARVLRPDGRAIIAHYDWLPLPGTVVAKTEELILKHNPDWAGAGGTGIYPDWPGDLSVAGLGHLETASFDLDQPYSHTAWRGRIRASAGIAASLPPADIARFDADLADMLSRAHPAEPLLIPHRVWLVMGIVG